MKRYSLLLLILPLLFANCRRPGNEETGNGSVAITYSVADAEGNSVDIAHSKLTIVLTGPVNKTIVCPSDGIVKGLPAGKYAIELCTHVNLPSPAHENPYYHGKAEAEVKTGKTTEVEVGCRLKNSGIVFEYDPSLATAGLDNIVMTVRQGGHTLVFSGDSSDKCGYFAPGKVEITMKSGDSDLTIGGEPVYTMELPEGKIYRMTVSLQGLVLSVSIEDTSDPTSTETILLDDYQIPEPDHVLTILKTCKIHWDPASGDAVRFDLSVVSEDRLYELWIRAFSPPPASGDKFYIAEGTYRAGRLPDDPAYGEVMTFALGHHDELSYMPTTGFKWSADGIYIDDAYYAEKGVIVVRRDGEGYTITADLTGDADIWKGWSIETIPDLRKIYMIKVPLVELWENSFVVPGDLEYDDVPLGSYTAYGTNIFYDNDGEPGPGSWSGNITGVENGWSLSKWSDIEGAFLLDYAYKRMWLSEGGTTVIDDNYVLRFSGAYLDHNNRPVLYWHPEVKFDKGSKTIDFSGTHFTGAAIGVCGVLDFQASGSYYLATDIYTEAKVTIAGSSGIPSFNGNALGLIPPDTSIGDLIASGKLIPLQTGNGRHGDGINGYPYKRRQP